MCQLRNGDLILAYSRDVKIYYKTSKDAGESWSSETRLTYDNVNVSPALMQDSTNRLWLVWTSSALGPYDLEYATSVDNGLTWDTRGLIHTPQEASQRGSVVETDDNRIWVFWSRPGHHVTTKDGGQTWTDLAETGVNMWNNPALYGAHDNQLWVVGWTGSDIWARNSSDGRRWSDPIKITDSDSARYPRIHPVIVQDAHGNLVAVWHSEHHESDNPDIWYSTSFSNGATWSSPIRLTYDKHIDLDPTLAVIDGALWVFWTSDRAGYYAIYPFRLNLNPCDFDSDDNVDFGDYAMFASYWRSDDSGDDDALLPADADQSGTIDIMDLVIFAHYWLEPTPHEVPRPPAR
ncbi:MAG: exo-alpha-sialidase [Phycisphaerales bacterium]|nr:MAG: exo-alpha-sialidase [Phycisphaerales bacterium]